MANNKSKNTTSTKNLQTQNTFLKDSTQAYLINYILVKKKAKNKAKCTIMKTIFE